MVDKDMKGWVSLWRELYKKPIWANSSPEHKAVLVVLLGLVNHEPAGWEWKGEPYTVKRGQTITSLESIKVLCGRGVSTQNIRSALLRFEKFGFLTNESTKTGRRITICNYNSYQKPADQTNKDANSQLTDNQQTANKQLTSNNKDNNDNKDNKERNTGVNYSADFLLFWENYPLKKEKSTAFKAYKKAIKIVSPDIILKAIEAQKVEKDRLCSRGLFCPDWPHPTTWLNKGRWEDEVNYQPPGNPGGNRAENKQL